MSIRPDAQDPWAPRDALGEALYQVRMRGVFYSQTEAGAPWASFSRAFTRIVGASPGAVRRGRGGSLSVALCESESDDTRGANMINGAHVILYSTDAEADRAFLADTLGFEHVDAGEGWLIFALPPAEVAVHPTGGEPKHEFYLMCDDIEQTLKLPGVEVARPVTDQGWGLLAAIRMPSGDELPIYQPRHPVAHGG